MIEMILFTVLLFAFLICVLTLVIQLLVLIIRRLRKTPFKNITKHMRRCGIAAGGIAIFMTVFSFINALGVKTPKILDSQGKEVPGSIAELRVVPLNGKDEWISIRGKNKNNPVLLFLAGGPGGSQMAAVRYHLAELEEHFVVVNWDQPGSCKSYFATNLKNITVDTYVQDGYALSSYLCKTFQKDKIYLVGESWGSALGIFMVKEHPELYHSFIGTGQMVDFLETEKMDYQKAIEIAEQHGDSKKAAKIKSNGMPPYYGSDVTFKSMEYLNYISAYMANDPEIHNSRFQTTKYILSSEYSVIDKINFLVGLMDTFNQVYPQLYTTDLRKDYAKLDVPVYFFIGRRDINAPTSLTVDYYNKLSAPKKELIWFEHSGHSPWINESDKFVTELLNTCATCGGASRE